MRPGQLHVAIIGAGATGTELSAELHRTARAGGGLRPRPDRPRQGHPDHPDRGRRPHPAGAAASASPTATTAPAARASASTSAPARGSPRCAPTACGSPTAASSRPSSWSGPPACKGPDVLRDLDGLEVSRSNQLVVHADAADHARPRHLRHRRLRLAARATGSDRPGAAARPGRAPAGEPRARADPPPAARASRCSPSSTATSARWCRSGEYSTVGNLMGFLVGKSMFIEG